MVNKKSNFFFGYDHLNDDICGLDTGSLEEKIIWCMLYERWKDLMREGKTGKTSSHTIVLFDTMAIVQCIARRKSKSCMYMSFTFLMSMHETKLRNSFS